MVKRFGGLCLARLQKAIVRVHIEILTQILQSPKCLCSFSAVNGASDCSGITHVNEVTSVCGIESIFRVCTIPTSVMDLHSFISHLVLLLFTTDLGVPSEVTLSASSGFVLQG